MKKQQNLNRRNRPMELFGKCSTLPGNILSFSSSAILQRLRALSGPGPFSGAPCLREVGGSGLGREKLRVDGPGPDQAPRSRPVQCSTSTSTAHGLSGMLQLLPGTNRRDAINRVEAVFDRADYPAIFRYLTTAWQI